MRKLLPARPRKQVLLFSGLLIVAVLLLAFVQFFVPSWFPGSKQESLDATRSQGPEDFLTQHWQRPIPLQGPTPAHYSALEASLRPESCGSCHAQQYANWKESLHSLAMGPGPWGQIVDLVSNSPEDAVQCMTCHAPLSEQLPVLPKRAAAGETSYEKNPHLDQPLQSRGITCAACHVRQHERYGPPKAEGASATQYPAGMANHSGARRTPYFEKAEFCKDCHQFDPENSLLVNGKPLQDTYREWKNSIWGKGDAACQDCHMPQRRHLWKGIHDREWVKGGIQFKATLEETDSRGKAKVAATIEVTNSAVGHKFPSYTTPKVFLRASLVDSMGKILPGTLKQYTIGWDVRFEDDEWKEYFDTRLSPGESFKQRFEWALPSKADKVRVWLEVHPDHFYHVHFYPAYLKRTNLSAEGRKLVERALEESGKTPYILYEEGFSLRVSHANKLPN
jgi:Cytochrome c552